MAEQLGSMVEHLKLQSTQPNCLTRCPTLYFLLQMGQGAASEQPAAHAGRLPPRLRLLAHVPLARQRGVERAGLQVDNFGCGKVSYLC